MEGSGMGAAAAPTYTEGAPGAFSFDLSGNLRVTLGTLLACEDQANNLCMVSGGVVRVVSIASNLLVAADCTSSCTPAVTEIIPVGSKTIEGRVVSTTSGATVTQTQKIYGSSSSSFTTDDAELLCTLVLSGTQVTTKAIVKSCPPITANYSYYGVISSATTTTGNAATGSTKAMY